jgi:hypothetical protein
MLVIYFFSDSIVFRKDLSLSQKVIKKSVLRTLLKKSSQSKTWKHGNIFFLNSVRNFYFNSIFQQIGMS